MAVGGKTLTALGSYWKGRKPLILNRACILGALLPATDNLRKDLEIFEMLMGMDEISFSIRMKSFKKKTPIVKESYCDLVNNSERAEKFGPELHAHIWEQVNKHLGTSAFSMPELIEQLGIMRFGHRPKVADPFCGSGQIPFEAARLGCDVYASDLNPIACMLTWAAFHIVGATTDRRPLLKKSQFNLAQKFRSEMASLGFESDGKGWHAKAFLYCHECVCQHTGWTVPMLPTFVISQRNRVIARLYPQRSKKRYKIEIVTNATPAEMKMAEKGTIQDGFLVHAFGKEVFRTRISTLRGDYKDEQGKIKNRLRRWDCSDIIFHEDDIYQERLYCIHWEKTTKKDRKEHVETEFRTVSSKDLEREQEVIDYVQKRLSRWQKEGWIPKAVIEEGDKTNEPIRDRGWTYWHHLFNPRQLLLCALVNRYADAVGKVAFGQLLNRSSRLCHWKTSDDASAGVFYNQALNTFWNYGCRGSSSALPLLETDFKSYPFTQGLNLAVYNHTADQVAETQDVYITDPPYGDAVKYEEITEFFISWLRKNPPQEFADWIWDSRRALAIAGEDEQFRQGMITSFEKMALQMSDNGIQILMFTHQSGSLWSDIANIVWASGLQVTAAWYVVTETSSALRNGNHVKGTVILVLRKRNKKLSVFRDELAIELQDEVASQVNTLVGLNQQTKHSNRDENLFSDADLQMAGYAAALRVLTRYAEIDGDNMTNEAKRPRIKGEKTCVDRLIEYAVEMANQFLIPEGIPPGIWNDLAPAERFYLKLLDLEAQGLKTLDNYQNFAKAFKVKDFKPLMASNKANATRLKTCVEFGKSEMAGESELARTPLRGILYALMELEKGIDSEQILAHLGDNVPNYLKQRPVIIALANYLVPRLAHLREREATHAKILSDLVRNERLT